MRPSKVLLGLFFVLLMFSTPCLAKTQDEIVNKLSEYAYKKAQAHGLAVEVQVHYAQLYNLHLAAQTAYTACLEKKCDAQELKNSRNYVTNTKDNLTRYTAQYLNVRKLYNSAAANFEELRFKLRVTLINQKHFPEEDDYYNDSAENNRVWEKANNNYDAFEKAVTAYFAAPTPEQPSTEYKGAPTDDFIINLVLPVVGKILDVRRQIVEERNTKRDKLIATVDEFFKWDTWGTIAQ